MAELFNRAMTLTVGDIKIPIRYIDTVNNTIQPSLRVGFAVTKTSDNNPNEAKITILNLNESHRKAIQAGEKAWPVTIDAGYTNNVQRIFAGQLQSGDPRKEGKDWVTEIFAKDGQVKYASARLNKSYGAGTSINTVLSDAAVALGLGAGNSAVQFKNPARPISLFSKGVVVTGRVVDILSKYVTTAGFQWSIQDGQLLVLTPDETTQETIFILNQDSGMIGTPEKGEKGFIKVVSLLQGDISPGRKIRMQAKEVRGDYKAEKVEHIGDSWGPSWYTQIEAKPLKGAA